MGREFASACARWIHLTPDRDAASHRRSVRHEPRRSCVVRASRSAATPRVGLSAGARGRHDRGRLRRCTAQPPRGDLHRLPASPGNTFSARSRSGSTSRRTRPSTPRSRRIPTYSSGARPSCRSIPVARRWRVSFASASTGARSRCGRCSTTRATSTRRSRSTGSALPDSTASTAAWATSVSTHFTCRYGPAGSRSTSARSCPTSSRYVPTVTAARSRATHGTTRCCCVRSRMRAACSRCASRRSASHPAK